MKKGKKLYYQAHRDKETGRVYKQPRYGYEMLIGGMTFYCSHKVHNLPAFNWMGITEEKTGYGCTIGEAVVTAHDIRQKIKNLPPVVSYPTLKELRKGN